MKNAWRSTWEHDTAKHYTRTTFPRRPSIGSLYRAQWLRTFTVVCSIAVVISLTATTVVVHANSVPPTVSATIGPSTAEAMAPQPPRHADSRGVSTITGPSPVVTVASGIVSPLGQHPALTAPPATSGGLSGVPRGSIIAPQPTRHDDGPRVINPAATTVVTSTATPKSTTTRTPTRGATVVVTATTTATQSPISTIALGAYVDSAPEYDTLPEYVSTVGSTPKILMWYRNWKNGPNPSFTPSDLDVAYKNGAMPMISWQPLDGDASDNQPTYSCANIIVGQYDGFITTWAQAAAAYQKPFYLRLAHEMNGDWYPWGTAPGNPNNNSPAQYIAMWRHVVTIFRQQGATNVRWVWSPNAISEFSTFSPFDQNYPGNEYVDWVGIDGYNFGTAYGSGWRTISEIFGTSYDALTAMTTKPIMIAEIGASEQGGNKAAWIQQGLLTEIPQRLPRVRALVWFDVKRDIDYRVNSSPASLAAFRAVVKLPLYQGILP